MPFLDRHLAAALAALGLATSIALPGWDMKKRDQQTHSVFLRLLVVKSIQENTAGAQIMFQTGQKGGLSRNRREYQFNLTQVRRSLEHQHPVGVRIDGAGEIGETARADNDYVAFLGEENESRVKVGFQGHDGIAYLERQHPRFDSIKRDLNRSLIEKKRIWFVWRSPRLTLEDVMIVDGD